MRFIFFWLIILSLTYKLSAESDDINLVLKMSTKQALLYQEAYAKVKHNNIQDSLRQIGIVPTREVEIDAYIYNKSNANVILVHPGDGSLSERGGPIRTPIVGWSVINLDEPHKEHPSEPTPDYHVRCGSFNALRISEIFTLQPGDSVKLNTWIGRPSFWAAGKYSVLFYYKNDPDLKWRGLLGKHDSEAMIEVRKSTKCSLISNELIFQVLNPFEE